MNQHFSDTRKIGPGQRPDGTPGDDGNHLMVYKMMTSHGATKRWGKDPWTLDEIEGALQRIIDW